MNTREAEELFLRELPLIEKVIGSSCRRGGLDRSEAEDVTGAIRLKLIENDYRVVRGYEGKSSLATWLTVVVQRFLIDYRNHRWGKWTPSAEATRLGACAVQLEKLLHRDGRSFEEACAILVEDGRFQTTRDELESMAARLPRRLPRPTTQSLEECEGARNIAAGESPEERLFAREKEALGVAASKTLDESIGAMDPEDRLLLRMRFDDEMSVAQIARSTGQEQRRLYYRLERLALSLRQALAAAGIDDAGMSELLRDGATTIRISFLGNSDKEASHLEGGIRTREAPAE